MAGEGFTGNYRVRVLRPPLHKSRKMFRRCRDQMELRAHALKLRYWPAMAVTEESGQLLDLDWSYIRALRSKNIAELRIADKIGGHENIRIIFYIGQSTPAGAMPIIWILEVMAKKNDHFTVHELKMFEARQTLVNERFYKNREN